MGHALLKYMEHERDNDEDSCWDRKGKSRATCQDLDWEMDQENQKHRCAKEQDTEHACLCAKHTLIAPQAVEMQRRELDMEHSKTVVALHD